MHGELLTDCAMRLAVKSAQGTAQLSNCNDQEAKGFVKIATGRWSLLKALTVTGVGVGEKIMTFWRFNIVVADLMVPWNVKPR